MEKNQIKKMEENCQRKKGTKIKTFFISDL